MDFLHTFAVMVWIVAWLWTIVIAFKHDQVAWGIASILIPIAPYLYGLLHIDKALKPFIMLVAGTLGAIAIELLRSGGVWPAHTYT